MPSPQEAKPVAVIKSKSRVLPTIDRRLGWPTFSPFAVAWLECSQVAPLRQTVEMINAKAFRKLRFTDVVLASPDELLLLPR